MDKRVQDKIKANITFKDTTLNLTGYRIDIEEIPFYSLSHVQILLLRNNSLTHIPYGFIDLVNLRSLDISVNHFEIFPDILLEMPHLSSLDISNNRLSELPDNIGNLVELFELNLGSNLLTKLPDGLKRIKRLTELKVDNNAIESIPSFLFGSNTFLRLDLSHNQIQDIPEVSGKGRMGSLNLENNKLFRLPDNIGNLEQLYYLNLRNNRLTSLPDSICQLSELNNFIIDDNSLEVLPDDFGLLTEVKNFSAAYNNLRQLPNSFSNLISLTEINLSNNELENLFDSFENLKFLSYVYLNNNNLTRLPVGVSNLSHLLALDIRNNNIDEIPAELRDLNDKDLMVDYRGNPFVEKALSRSERYKKIWHGIPYRLRDLLKTYFSSFSTFYFEKTQRTIEFNVLNDADGLIFDIVPNENTNPDEVDKYLEEYFDILKQKLGEGARDGFIYPTSTDDQANFYAQTQAIGLSYGILRIKDTIQGAINGQINDQDAFRSVKQLLITVDDQIKDVVKENKKLWLENQEHRIGKASLQAAYISQQDELTHRRLESQTRAQQANIVQVEQHLNQQIVINNQISDAFDKLVDKLYDKLGDKQKGDAKDLQKEIDAVTDNPKATPEEKKGLGKRLKRFVEGMQETLKTTKGFGEAVKDAGEQFDKLKEFAGSVLNNPQVVEAIEQLKHLVENPPSI